jgi:hypothetical protein
MYAAKLEYCPRELFASRFLWPPPHKVILLTHEDLKNLKTITAKADGVQTPQGWVRGGSAQGGGGPGRHLGSMAGVQHQKPAEGTAVVYVFIWARKKIAAARVAAAGGSQKGQDCYGPAFQTLAIREQGLKLWRQPATSPPGREQPGQG